MAELEVGMAALERRVEELREATPTREDLASLLRALETQVDSRVAANADLKEDLRQILAEMETLRIAVEEQRRTSDGVADLIDQTTTDAALTRAELGRQRALLAAIDERLERTVRESLLPVEAEVDPKSTYNTAYEKYFGGEYEQAAAGFRRYLDTYPEGADADSAQYWLGESYLAQGLFQSAIDELAKVEETYPDSEKVASSMLRIGIAHIELGETEEAAAMLVRVRDEYPDSDEAILALQRLDNLGNEE